MAPRIGGLVRSGTEQGSKDKVSVKLGSRAASERSQSPGGIRTSVGLVISVVILATVFAAALLTPVGSIGVTGAVETASAASGQLLSTLAMVLPLSYAFGAGMVAAVNPCGFAMLPAYLTLYLRAAGPGQDDPSSALGTFLKASRIGATVCAGFVLLFGLAGLLLGVGARLVALYLPWVGLAVGVTLVLLGSRMLIGGSVYLHLGDLLAGRAGGGTNRSGSRGYLAYGIAYGAASLSCTLPIFLTVVGGALATGGLGTAMLQFVLYALGMGFVVIALTLGVAFVERATLDRVRRLGRYARPASSVLTLLAGAYIVYYWLTLGGLLATAL